HTLECRVIHLEILLPVQTVEGHLRQPLPYLSLLGRMNLVNFIRVGAIIRADDFTVGDKALCLKYSKTFPSLFEKK
ncbi:MAG: hypothetical protein IJV54_10935, partial [Bacteroidales bacterium]|nr:hypothetical protein [Bacteroidales bacterium]